MNLEQILKLTPEEIGRAIAKAVGRLEIWGVNDVEMFRRNDGELIFVAEICTDLNVSAEVEKIVIQKYAGDYGYWLVEAIDDKKLASRIRTIQASCENVSQIATASALQRAQAVLLCLENGK